MSPDLQQLFAYGLVVLAAGWLLARWWRPRRRQACDRCAAGSAPAPRPRGKGVRPSSLRVLR